MSVRYPKKPQLEHSEIIESIPKACSDELAAVEFLEAQRWPHGPACIHCGDVNVYKMVDKATGQRNRRYRWRCHGCKQQFTVRQGTVYEESRIPLRHWVFAFWAMNASKKGVSALQIKRQTGLSYKSALFLAHRVRYAMTPECEKQEKLSGTIECDECYVGGKPRYKGNNPRGRGTNKQPVFAMMERGGRVRAMPMTFVTGDNLKTEMRLHIDKSARIHTDESNMYDFSGGEFDGGHQTVNHGAKEYARGDVTTNNVEGFFSLFKRGLNGVYHAVSRRHLHRYLGEFEYRFNTRKLNDGERTTLAIQSAEGKRLMYRQPKDEAA